jgi:hypothetical protein
MTDRGTPYLSFTVTNGVLQSLPTLRMRGTALNRLTRIDLVPALRRGEVLILTPPLKLHLPVPSLRHQRRWGRARRLHRGFPSLRQATPPRPDTTRPYAGGPRVEGSDPQGSVFTLNTHTPSHNTSPCINTLYHCTPTNQTVPTACARLCTTYMLRVINADLKKKKVLQSRGRGRVQLDRGRHINGDWRIFLATL